MMTTKKTKKKTVKKVKDTTDIGVLEPEIVEAIGDRREQAQVPQVLEKNTKEVAVFEPTKKMMLWLNYEVANPNLSTEEISRATNVSTNSYYGWRQNLDFLRWYKQEWDRRLIIHAPKLDKIGMKNADGNYKYWVSMQQRVGNLEQQAIKLQNNIQMNVNFMEDDGHAPETDVV